MPQLPWVPLTLPGCSTRPQVPPVPSRAEVTRLYRAHLHSGNAGLLALLAGLWAKMFDPAQPMASLRQLGALAGPFITQGQASSVTQARSYLAALTTQATGQRRPAPYQVAPGVIGTSASGHSIMALASLAPAVYMARLSAGQPEAMAAAGSQAWLNRLAASEPYRAANAQVHHSAGADPRLTGQVERITSPGACEFCTGIADEGYTPAAADFAAHAN